MTIVVGGAVVIVVVGTICVLIGGSAADDAYGPGSAGDTAVVVMTDWVGAATTAGLIAVPRRCGPPNASTSTALSRASSPAPSSSPRARRQPNHPAGNGAESGVSVVPGELPNPGKALGPPRLAQPYPPPTYC